MQDKSHNTHLFRLATLAILILIFVTVATIKIWEVRVAAERVGVLHTLGNLRSAIGLKLSKMVIQEGMAALTQLDHSNPMQLWNPPPSNYLGEFTTSEAPDAQGAWYFDLEQQILVYRVRFGDHFSSSNLTYPQLARYQLRMSYHDSNGNQQYDAEVEQISGLTLEPVDHYLWLSDPDVSDAE